LAGIGRRVPGGRVERHVLPPDDSDADHIYECNEERLGEHGIAQLECRLHRGIQSSDRVFRYQLPIPERLRHRAHALVNDQFRVDEQRHCQQEPDVHFDVHEKWHGSTAGQQSPTRSRQHQ
jgi:hypothetical protein